MESYIKIEEMLSREIDKISEKGELSATMLNSLHILTDTMKNILKIEMLEDSAQYSNDGGYWEAIGSYEDDNSMRRRRYSRDGHRMTDNYSRGNVRDGNIYRNSYKREMPRTNYSRDDSKRYIMDSLETMMGEAGTEKEREALRKCMQSFEMA